MENWRPYNYYYQVQGVMAITGRTWCDFVVWTPKGISIERIQYNESFWADQMCPKLLEFYDKALLPELAAPEHPNGMQAYKGARDLVDTIVHTKLTLPFELFCGLLANVNNMTRHAHNPCDNFYGEFPIFPNI